MRVLLLLKFMLLYSALCTAQVANSFYDDDRAYIAKLEKEAKETNSDSLRAYNYLKLSVICKQVNDTLKAATYLKHGLALSEKKPFLKSVSYYYRARALYSTGNVAAINDNLIKADSMLKQFTYKEAYRVRASVWYHYSAFQQSGDNAKEALNTLLNKAMPNAQKSGDPSFLGQVNNGIAIILMNSNQQKKAHYYLARAATYYEELPADATHRLLKTTTCYLSIAENYLAQGIYDSAKLELDKVKPILIARPSSTNIHSDYYFIEGAYFDKTKRYAEAIKSFDKGISIVQSPILLNNLKYAKFQALSNKKDYQQALILIEDLLKSPAAISTDKKEFYKDLYTTYNQLGNSKEAFKWSKRYSEFSDSLYAAKYQNDVVELEAKFSNAENQKKIYLLQAEKEKAILTSANNRLLIGLLGGTSTFLLAISIIGWHLYRNTKKLSTQKEKNYQHHLKEEEQKRQVQFAKALLQGEEKERKRLASDLHDGLGGMLAGVKTNLSRLVNNGHTQGISIDLNKAIHQLDNSVNELRRIARNMMPESLVSLGLEAALGDMCSSLTSDYTSVDFQPFNIDNTLAEDTQVTLYRIVQELLTNAMRHAQATQIVVQCSQNENTFFITIEDNGRGFEPSVIHFQNGLGISNVKSRVDYLNGKIDIASLPGDGTTINIELNVAP